MAGENASASSVFVKSERFETMPVNSLTEHGFKPSKTMCRLIQDVVSNKMVNLAF